MPEVLYSERKLVTVLFADIQGSLALIQGRDPERASTLLEARVDLMIEAVQTFGGTINRVMGDGIMALFGAPRAAEHHALNACLSALRIRETATRTMLASDEEVSVRVGLASGEVVVKPIVAGHFAGYDAAGEIVHLAARMEHLAPANGILITSGTARLVNGDVVLRPLGPVRIKGLPSRMDVFELLALQPKTPRWLQPKAWQRAAPVGRDREFALIADAREQAASGRGRVISISGDAGCGKSRLLYETLCRDPGDWMILSGQAVAFDNKGYRVILDMLAGLFGLEPDDDAATALNKILGWLRRHGEDALIVPLAYLHQLDVPDADWRACGPAERGRRIQQAIIRLFEVVGDRQNAVIVAEDLHWIDPESLRILDQLAHLVAGRKMLLVVTFRPETEPPWTDLPHHTGLRVGPLTEADSRTLLRGRLARGAGVDALEQDLIERSGGNPLFLEEMLTNLEEEGVITRGGGRYRLSQSERRPGLPDSVRSLLTDRIDRLFAPEKNVLQAAAVVGHAFPVRLLDKVMGTQTVDVAAACERLHQAGFLEPTAGPGSSYAFRHVLMADAAYAGLLHPRRETLHGRVVDALEALYPDRIAEHVEVLARHAEAARRWEKAADYGARAGANAAARDACAEAVGFYQRALECIQNCVDTSDRRNTEIELHLSIRDPLFRLGRLEQIVSHLQQADPLLEPFGACARRGMFQVLYSHVLSLTGDPEGALRACAEALRIAGVLGDPALAARAHFQQGFARFSCGDFTGADAALRSAICYLAENPGETGYGLNRGVAVAALSYRARTRAAMGNMVQAEGDTARMLALAEQHGSPFEWSFACIAAAEVSDCAGQPEAAASWLGDALIWCDKADAPLLAVTAAARLGLIETRLGRVSAGLARLREAVATAEDMGFQLLVPFGLMAMAEAAYAIGDLETAGELAERARTLSVAIGDKSVTEACVLLLGRVGMGGGYPDPVGAEWSGLQHR